MKGQPSTSLKRLKLNRARLASDFDRAEEKGDISTMESLVASIEAIDESIAELSVEDSTEDAPETEAVTESPEDEAAEDEDDEDDDSDEDSDDEDDAEDTASAEVTAETAVDEPTAEVDEPVVADTTAEDAAPAAEAISTTEDSAPAEVADTTVANTEEITAMAASGTDIEVPQEHAPVITASASATVVAGTDIPGFSAGQVLKSDADVSQAFVKRLDTLRRVQGGDGDAHIVASIQFEYPEERRLNGSDIEGNTAKIDALLSPQALTASGGWCAPLPTRYEIYGLGDGGRPVRDSLPKFNATRGGVQFTRPPELVSYRGAVGFMDGSDGSVDLAFGGVTLSYSNGDIVGDGSLPAKPVLSFNCPAPEQAVADAITLALKFGNLTSRAFPELVARHNQLALIQHARLAEDVLLAKIGLFAAQEAGGVVLAKGAWGAVRDTLVAVAKAAVAFRFRHRLDKNFPLNFLAPQWLLDVMREDLFVGLPGDQLSLADSKINSFFADRSIRPIWHRDGFTTAGGSTISGETFIDPAYDPDGSGAGGTTAAEARPDPVIATSEGSVANFPGQVTGFLFAEGSLLYLDAGTLDLGIIRDSTLVGTNDYMSFVETFEGLANIGYRPMMITAPVNIAGAVTGTIDPADAVTIAAAL